MPTHQTATEGSGRVNADKKFRKQHKALKFLQSQMSDLPDEPLDAIQIARDRLGMKTKRLLPSHSSIMAHFNVIFSKLGVKLGQTDMQRKATRRVAVVTGPAFLRSYEWRKLRMQALKLHGAKCLCCGITPHDGAKITVDHIQPRKTHPHLALELDNLQILCNECNHGKGNWDDTDWRVKQKS